MANIYAIDETDIPECAMVIKASFLTVAQEFGFTIENAPRFTAFAITPEILRYCFSVEHRPMYAWHHSNGRIGGYYSLHIQNDGICELNNFCVHPDYRHNGVGSALLCNAFKTAQAYTCSIMNIGIVEENQRLRHWYEQFGFVHTGTKKFEFFPFTSGYLTKKL